MQTRAKTLFLLKNEIRCRIAYGLKKNKNNVYFELTLSEKKNRLKTDKYNECNPYIVYIFVFTALIHCILEKDTETINTKEFTSKRKDG